MNIDNVLSPTVIVSIISGLSAFVALWMQVRGRNKKIEQDSLDERKREDSSVAIARMNDQAEQSKRLTDRLQNEIDKCNSDREIWYRDREALNLKLLTLQDKLNRLSLYIYQLSDKLRSNNIVVPELPPIIKDIS